LKARPNDLYTQAVIPKVEKTTGLEPRPAAALQHISGNFP
jgi:hypothetical protein